MRLAGPAERKNPNMNTRSESNGKSNSRYVVLIYPATHKPTTHVHSLISGSRMKWLEVLLWLAVREASAHMLSFSLLLCLTVSREWQKRNGREWENGTHSKFENVLGICRINVWIQAKYLFSTVCCRCAKEQISNYNLGAVEWVWIVTMPSTRKCDDIRFYFALHSLQSQLFRPLNAFRQKDNPIYDKKLITDPFKSTEKFGMTMPLHHPFAQADGWWQRAIVPMNFLVRFKQWHERV